MTTANGYTEQEISDMVDAYYSSLLPKTSARDILTSLNGDLNEWVYQGIVCDSYTMIVGAPKQGKSRIAVNIAAAYSRGEPFLNISPATGNDPQNVLIVSSEANAEKENVSRLQNIGADLDRVFIDKIGSSGIAEESYTAAEAGNIGLVIVDNVMGLCRGVDINKPEAVTAISNATERFNLAGVPVIFIHHTSKGTGSNPVYSAMGNAGIAGLMRHLVSVTRRDDVTTLTTNGNFETSTFKLKFNDQGKATLAESPDTKKRDRDSKTLDTNKEIARLAVESGETTTTAVAEYVAKIVGLSASTVRTHRLDPMVKSGVLTKQRGKPYAYGSKYRP